MSTKKKKKQINIQSNNFVIVNLLCNDNLNKIYKKKENKIK